MVADSQDNTSRTAGGNQADNRYELAIGDLLQIPDDRLDDFIVDLKKWHSAVRATLNLLDTIAEATGEKPPSTMAKMTWIDDGKHDGKIIFKTPTKVTDLVSNNPDTNTSVSNPPKDTQ